MTRETPQHEPPAPAALLQARRNAQARKQLLDEFGALKAVEVADLAGSTAENRSATANRWRHEGRIFGVRYQDAVYYPGFQFADDGQPLPAIEMCSQYSSRPGCPRGSLRSGSRAGRAHSTTGVPSTCL